MSKAVSAQRSNYLWRHICRNWGLYLLLLPAVILMICFTYIPMFGIVIAFKDFTPAAGIFGSPWAGWKYFQEYFNSYQFWPTIKNTLIISLYTILVTFPLPIVVALMCNQITSAKYKKFFQVSTYLPHFISTVVMCGMIILFLSPSVGVINNIVQFFGGDPVNFMAKKEYWRHIYVWTGIWQGMGWSSVIYFAALSGISPELHEAAKCDGATKLQLIRHIDLPSIMPTATVLLIMNCGSILSIGFEKAYLLQNDLNLNVSEIISTYVYKVGLINNDMSYSTAIGLFNTLVNLVMLLIVNKAADKLSGNSLW